MTLRRARRSGFTLIELLVVIGIIGVLVALLIPAVQSSRSAARRILCQNQLRQLGLALHQYHESHLSFPPGSFMMGPSFPIQSGWGWGAMILPYIDQRPLYHSIDFGEKTAVGKNLPIIQTVVPFWRCPSEVAPDRIHTKPLSYPAFELVSGNYCGSEGILSVMASVRLEEIIDGTSQTLLLGERMVQVGGAEVLPVSSAWFGHMAYPDGYEYRCVPHLQPNPGSPINASRTDTQCFGSYHAGGANFVFADGSARFLSQHIDGELWLALGTSQGGEAVTFP